jgi:hypothetical protein
MFTPKHGLRPTLCLVTLTILFLCLTASDQQTSQAATVTPQGLSSSADPANLAPPDASLSIDSMNAVITTVPTATPAGARVIGGQLFATGGPVEVEIKGGQAALLSELHLIEPGPDRFIATNKDIGKIVSLGTFTPGVELVFGIVVRGHTFVMGPAGRNPDNVIHAAVTFLGNDKAVVGFEDLLGGGDLDYNDCLFEFRGGIAATPQPTNTVPPQPTNTMPPPPTTTIPTPTYTSTPPVISCADGYTYTPGMGPGGASNYVKGSSINNHLVTIDLPFPFTLYDKTFTKVNAATNGILEFGSSVAQFSNTCLPSTKFKYTLFPFWDEIYVIGRTPCLNEGECGIWTEVSGTEPQRIFTIRWLGVAHGTLDNVVDFTVHLYEEDNSFDFVYENSGSGHGESATIGVQLDTGCFTQISCNAPIPILASALTSGPIQKADEGATDSATDMLMRPSADAPMFEFRSTTSPPIAQGVGVNRPPLFTKAPFRSCPFGVCMPTLAQQAKLDKLDPHLTRVPVDASILCLAPNFNRAGQAWLNCAPWLHLQAVERLKSIVKLVKDATANGGVVELNLWTLLPEYSTNWRTRRPQKPHIIDAPIFSQRLDTEAKRLMKQVWPCPYNKSPGDFRIMQLRELKDYEEIKKELKKDKELSKLQPENAMVEISQGETCTSICKQHIPKLHPSWTIRDANNMYYITPQGNGKLEVHYTGTTLEEDFAKPYAALVWWLVEEQHVNVKPEQILVSAQNEPNGTPLMVPGEIITLYKDINQQLIKQKPSSEKGKVKLVAGELVPQNFSTEWIKALIGTNDDDGIALLIDALTFHPYWNQNESLPTFERKLHKLKQAVITAWQLRFALSRTRPPLPPLLVTEYGVRGERTDDEKAGLHEAQALIAITNEGFSAPLRWGPDYLSGATIVKDDPCTKGKKVTDDWNPWALIDGKGKALRAYYVIQLFNMAIAPGWKPVAMTDPWRRVVLPKQASDKKLSVSSYRAPIGKGVRAVIVANKDTTTRKIKVGGFGKEGLKVKVITYDARGEGFGLNEEPEFKLVQADGSVTVPVPPSGVVAVRTWNLFSP